MGYRMMCNQENLREEPREAPVAPGLVDLDVSTTREEQRMAARNRFAQRSAPEKKNDMGISSQSRVSFDSEQARSQHPNRTAKSRKISKCKRGGQYRHE